MDPVECTICEGTGYIQNPKYRGMSALVEPPDFMLPCSKCEGKGEIKVKTYWLLREASEEKYFGVYQASHTQTSDRAFAIRFARREDASRLNDYLMINAASDILFSAGGTKMTDYVPVEFPIEDE